MNNKELGTAFEKEMCDRLSKNGYWVHFITPDRRGAQPFDIIAVKDGFAMAIECKTLSNQSKWFSHNRLEDNQLLAMEKWLACGNLEPMIAISWRSKILFVTYSGLKEMGKINMEEEWNKYVTR